MTKMDEETIERIRQSIGDGMSSVMKEYTVWLRMNELNNESEKLKKQIQPNYFSSMLKAEVVKQYQLDNAIRVKLTPISVSFEDEIKEVKLPSLPNSESKLPKQTNNRRRLKRNQKLDEETEEKKATRKKKNAKARLVCEDDEIIADIDSKLILNSQYRIGRAKAKSSDDHFICLHTENRSISHEHGHISYDKEKGLFLYTNVGRNGSVVNGKTLLSKDQAVLTNNSTIEVGGYKMKLVYITN